MYKDLEYKYYIVTIVVRTPFKPFKAFKGLRHGDPLSPYLFTLCMLYLSKFLLDASKDPRFSYHPRCRKVGITHLLFADYPLMFCRAYPNFVDILMHNFKGFSRASGLEVNEGKSSTYISRVAVNIKSDVIDFLGMPKGSFRLRCLGVPLYTKQLNIHDCRLLVDKILGKIKF